MIHVIALPHLFDATRRVTFDAPPAPIRDLYARLATGYGIERCYCEIGGKRVSDPDFVPPDGTTVYLKTIPSGGSNQDAGVGMKVVGGLMAAAGIIMSIASYGTLGGVGMMLISAGVGMFAGGVAMYNIQIPETSLPENPVTRPGIKGSRNRERPYGSVPVLFGRHLVTPDLAAKPYITIENNEIYLTQLFCAGYSDMEIEAGTFKIGDTRLAELSASGDIDRILSGSDPVFHMEILSGASSPGTVYPRRVAPIDVNRQVKAQFEDGSDGAVIVTTPAETTFIEVNLSFPQGLFALKDNGGRKETTVRVDLLIKPADADDSAYSRFGYVNGAADVTANEKKRCFFLCEKQLPPDRGPLKPQPSARRAIGSSRRFT